ncbi:trihelix transcription factor GT-2-like [Musa troglodytarum]|uniref:Trihelix transcription factor GT-2-like n=1 Tax=Musa troglodytarum TaxID=320322 RepID=A0A9E7JC28_9LILI|nr:trihelix transcription factor GT-2-like [Musa troglodytarum]
MDLQDLHNLIAGKPGFSAVSDVSDPAHFLGQRHSSFIPAPGPDQQYGMLVAGSRGGEVDLRQPPPPPPLPPPGMESFGFYETAFGGGGGGGGQGRWPRQETLTLLEVRSRLDSRFREAAHKGPLWDEVSRIMAEEHGYHRSGKKCREKLENLYKYYKKTKEGKAGRQDGKHYRFFRQLEALYGGSSSATPEIIQPCSKPTYAFALPSNREALQVSGFSGNVSLSSSSEFDGTSSTGEEGEEEDGSMRRAKTGRKSWKSKVEELVDEQIKRFIEVQETWMNQMLRTLEHMEQARISREEDWRRQEAARVDREYGLWASERAWMEARDAAIIQALEKISRRELRPQPQEDRSANGEHGDEADGTWAAQRWPESETASLVRIRRSMEAEFGEGGSGKAGMWGEVSATTACLGTNRSAKGCKERWDDVNKRSRKAKESQKKRRSGALKNKHGEGSCSEPSVCHEEGEQGSDVAGGLALADGPPSPPDYDGGVNGVNEISFLFSVAEDESLWENGGGVRNTGG